MSWATGNFGLVCDWGSAPCLRRATFRGNDWEKWATSLQKSSAA